MFENLIGLCGTNLDAFLFQQNFFSFFLFSVIQSCWAFTEICIK
jgi:hypothetical protein